MGKNNQKDQKGPKMMAAVMLVQNNQNNQKIWFPHNSESAFFLGHPVDKMSMAINEVGPESSGEIIQISPTYPWMGTWSHVQEWSTICCPKNSRKKGKFTNNDKNV